MIIENKENRTPSSFQAFFYKHVTTYRGHKYHKAEQFNTKLILKMFLKTFTRFIKNYWW
jgi:hypothetical protein